MYQFGNHDLVIPCLTFKYYFMGITVGEVEDLIRPGMFLLKMEYKPSLTEIHRKFLYSFVVMVDPSYNNLIVYFGGGHGRRCSMKATGRCLSNLVAS
jgi:hypothetical protein